MFRGRNSLTIMSNKNVTRPFNANLICILNVNTINDSKHIFFQTRGLPTEIMEEAILLQKRVACMKIHRVV